MLNNKLAKILLMLLICIGFINIFYLQEECLFSLGFEIPFSYTIVLFWDITKIAIEFLFVQTKNIIIKSLLVIVIFFMASTAIIPVYLVRVWKSDIKFSKDLSINKEQDKEKILASSQLALLKEEKKLIEDSLKNEYKELTANQNELKEALNPKSTVDSSVWGLKREKRKIQTKISQLELKLHNIITEISKLAKIEITTTKVHFPTIHESFEKRHNIKPENLDIFFSLVMSIGTEIVILILVLAFSKLYLTKESKTEKKEEKENKENKEKQLTGVMLREKRGNKTIKEFAELLNISTHIIDLNESLEDLPISPALSKLVLNLEGEKVR